MEHIGVVPGKQDVDFPSHFVQDGGVLTDALVLVLRRVPIVLRVNNLYRKPSLTIIHRPSHHNINPIVVVLVADPLTLVEAEQCVVGAQQQLRRAKVIVTCSQKGTRSRIRLVRKVFLLFCV